MKKLGIALLLLVNTIAKGEITEVKIKGEFKVFTTVSKIRNLSDRNRVDFKNKVEIAEYLGDSKIMISRIKYTISPDLKTITSEYLVKK